jgi:hypothetical protein
MRMMETKTTKKKTSIHSISEAETPDIKEEEEESQSETEDYNQ